MSRELLYSAINKMFFKLNELIEARNFDLMDHEVQKYSRRLDRLIIRYSRLMEKEKVG